MILPRSFVEGVANAAAASSMLGILMQVFPGRESSITAWTEMSLGLGYMLGEGGAGRVTVAPTNVASVHLVTGLS